MKTRLVINFGSRWWRVLSSLAVVTIILVAAVLFGLLKMPAPVHAQDGDTLVPASLTSGSPESIGLLCTDDVHGANDEPGQKDLTRMCVDSSVDPLQIEFNWDEIYGGGANTYDACTLFDTDGDGNANYSFCTTVSANPGTDIMEYKTITLYSCGDDKTDRCTQPVNVETPSIGTSCSVSQAGLDPFPAGAAYPLDTIGSCSIILDDVGGDIAVMLNVCSFPSQQPNSDPSDCISEPGSGFLTVVKQASPDISDVAFDFTIHDGATTAYTPTIYGSGASERFGLLEGTYSITETVPVDWSLDSAVCEDIVHGPVGTPNLSQNGVFDIIIASGSDVTCTFSDSRVYSPDLTTTPQPSEGLVGDTLQDSADLTGGYNPTGTITFRLYDPDDVTCSELVVYSETVPVNGNGTYNTSTGFKAMQAGVYRWVAEYSGDDYNNPASSGCDDEQVTISKHPTTTTTLQSPTYGRVGDTLNDTATVTSNYPVTGSVTFKLFAPGDDTCRDAVFTQTVALSDGSAATDPGYENNMAGTWRWTAEYSGDFANYPSQSGCDDELVEIDKYDPIIRTEPDPTGGLVGVVLNDKAILTSDYELTGDVLFKLYEPGDETCQTEVYSQTVTVGDADPQGVVEVITGPGHTSDMVGTWRWTAEYLGDFANYPSKSGCDDELVDIIKHTPTITTTPDPVVGFIWDRLHDSAVVSSAYDTTGTLTFSLYPPDDTTCQEAAYEETVPLVEGEASTEIGFLGSAAGVWRWKARYSGDANNNPAESGCDDELVTLNMRYLYMPVARFDAGPPVCSFNWRQTGVGYQVRIDLVWENAAPPEVAPEAHRVKWGDNTHTKFTGESGERAFWHTYAEPGWYYVYIMLWGKDGEKYFPCEGWVDPP